MTADKEIPWIDEDRIRAARRLCFFAHYHQYGCVPEHTRRYLQELLDCGFVIVLLSTSQLIQESLDYLKDTGIKVIVRDNVGMDFGGWIEACMRFFPIDAELLLLANDSVYGPLTPLSAFIDKMVAYPADFYGAVESLEIAKHLQSWFIILRPQAYRSAAFQKLMCRPMKYLPDKLALVTYYEIGLTQRLIKAGLSYHAAFSVTQREGIARRFPYNAAHVLWREIIEAGVPFLKVDLLRTNRMRVTNTSHWQSVILRHAPDFVSLIQHDLEWRGVNSASGFMEMSAWPAIYWPELQRIIISDYRSSPNGRGWRGFVHLAALLVILALVTVPRRLYARSIVRATPKAE